MEFDQTEIGLEDEEMPTKSTRMIPISANPEIEKQVRASKQDLLTKTNKTDNNTEWKEACKKYIALTDFVSEDPQNFKAKSLIELSGLQKIPLKQKKENMICFRSIDPNQQVWVQNK